MAVAVLAVAAAPARAQLPADFFGIEAKDVAFGTNDYRNAGLQQQASLGIGVLRQLFDWSAIERTRGQFSLGTYDSIVGDAARHGLRVLPIVHRAPDFYTGRPSNASGDWHPSNPADIGGVLRALVGRYGPNGSFWSSHPNVPKVPIRAWQIWNEPHLPGFWGPDGPNPGEYTALLRAAHDAIKAADPGGEVVAAGISQSTLQGAMSLQDFLTGMEKAGAKSLMDDFAVHPYATQPSDAMSIVRLARSIMNKYSDDGGIWITEMGWATGGPNNERPSFTTDEAGQANRLTTFLTDLLAARASLRIRGFSWYDWRDTTQPGYDDWSLHTGLLRKDGSAKPALAAYRNAIQSATRPAPAPTTPPPAPNLPAAATCADPSLHPKGSFVGISAPDVLGAAASYRRCTLALLADSGVDVIRQPFDWSRIEVSRGTYRLDAYDDLVADAARFGLRVLPVLVHPPAFRARRAGRRLHARDLAAFARVLQQRYGPKGTLWRERGIHAVPVHAWQVWDAPNLRRQWASGAGAYARLLRTVRRTLRRGDRHALVVTGALSSGSSARRFAASLARRRSSWDVLGTTVARRTAGSAYRSVRALRRALNQAGARRKAIWVTSLAWADAGPRSSLRVGAAGQASRIRAALRTLARHRRGLRLRGVVYAAWRDEKVTGRDTTAAHIGLVAADGKAKPAFQAFQQAARSAR